MSEPASARARAAARPRPREPPVMRVIRDAFMRPGCAGAAGASRARRSGDRRSLADGRGRRQDGSMDRAQLAEFLRHRREALHPEDVGLSRGPRRRTPGLRREEVAQLAGISTDYLNRLEQARGPQPSPQVLGALARALRLGADERDHLFRLAGHPAPERGAGSTHVSPALLRILDRLPDTPAQVMSELGETLAQTAPAKVLLGDNDARQGLER